MVVTKILRIASCLSDTSTVWMIEFRTLTHASYARRIWSFLLDRVDNSFSSLALDAEPAVLDMAIRSEGSTPSFLFAGPPFMGGSAHFVFHSGRVVMSWAFVLAGAAGVSGVV